MKMIMECGVDSGVCGWRGVGGGGVGGGRLIDQMGVVINRLMMLM